MIETGVSIVKKTDTHIAWNSNKNMHSGHVERTVTYWQWLTVLQMNNNE